MPDHNLDLLIVGSGLGGLSIAVTAARRGLNVRCVGDGRPGASLANFGQLHSGAVYAPVLPKIAAACWQHRDRWHDLARPALVGQPYGHALFDTADAVDAYRSAWHQIGIVPTEINPNDHAITAFGPHRPVAAFRIPDLSVDLIVLHARTVRLALANQVPMPERRRLALRRDSPHAPVTTDSDDLRPRTIVLACGADTPDVLTAAGIEHTLRTRRIAWGTYTGSSAACLTYWLDGDLLGISPDRKGARVGLPGVYGQYGTSEAESARLRTALAGRHLDLTDHDLTLHWGTVCEPSGDQADPSGLVIDLRYPPEGWSHVANLIVALPGKWTTAWHCADQVLTALD
jgi:glycine/D-amino acid oxidase-like deaminating enzyme